MFLTIQKSSIYSLFVFSLVGATPLLAGKLSVSTEVQANIQVLADTKNCPQCDLNGAILNRLDLSGANLEGADLSRAKLFLSNLAGANLRNTNLKEAQFGGADLAGADLTGADLTGASLAGAYLVGTMLDGEMVSTKPYELNKINDVEENVYVEDTTKPKSNPATEDISIGSRRDFEESSPAVIVETPKNDVVQQVEDTFATETEASVPETIVDAPMAKSSPAMENVLIKEENYPVDVTESKSPEPVAVSAVTEEENVDKEVVVVEETIKTSEIENISEEDAVAEAPIVAEASGITAVQTTRSDVVVSAIPDNVMVNIEKLLDTNNCYGCDLSGVNLTGTNLDSADLEGANLSNAILAGADLEDANLKGANLRNANLSGADLSGADLYKADLSGADLSNAKLEKILLDDAKMEGVKGYQPVLLLMEAN